MIRALDILTAALAVTLMAHAALVAHRWRRGESEVRVADEGLSADRGGVRLGIAVSVAPVRKVTVRREGNCVH